MRRMSHSDCLVKVEEILEEYGKCLSEFDYSEWGKNENETCQEFWKRLDNDVRYQDLMLRKRRCLEKLHKLNVILKRKFNDYSYDRY